MNRKYKVGDRVKIISRETVNSLPQTGKELKYHFAVNMRKYCGKTAAIKMAEEDLYILDIDHGCYNWCCDMFEKERSSFLKNE